MQKTTERIDETEIGMTDTAAQTSFRIDHPLIAHQKKEIARGQA